MKITEYKAGEVKCIDDGKTKGVVVGCEGRNLVSLIFADSVPHSETDRLARTLEKMNLTSVVVQIGY